MGIRFMRARRSLRSGGLRGLVSLVPVLLATLAAPVKARAAPSPVEDALDDRVADGDLDEEDRSLGESNAALAPLPIGAVDRGIGSGDARGASWISAMAFDRQLLGGRTDVGGVVVVGLALDRVTTGAVHRLADPPSPAPSPPPGPSPSPGPSPPAPPAAHSAENKPALTGPLARTCVAAAWRTAGLDADDARLDDLASRSRASALLPETRVRAMRLWNDAAHETTLATSDTSYYASTGANLVLELRLTWRLDRLIYAGDEPALERVRLEREEARSRIATRTLEALFAWQRGTVDATLAVAGSREEALARLRSAEAAATLDVMTGGWFSERGP